MCIAYISKSEYKKSTDTRLHAEQTERLHNQTQYFIHMCEIRAVNEKFTSQYAACVRACEEKYETSNIEISRRKIRQNWNLLIFVL